MSLFIVHRDDVNIFISFGVRYYNHFNSQQTNCVETLLVIINTGIIGYRCGAVKYFLRINEVQPMFSGSQAPAWERTHTQ